VPFDSVGTEQLRVDGRDKLTGQAKFVADLNWPGMLHARILRSTQAHALIKDLDLNKAREIYGVRAVVTGWDCPGPFGACFADQYPMAREKVRFYGEPVAAVIADTEDIARLALERIGVVYQPLPVLLEPAQSAADRKILIHEHAQDYNHIPGMDPIPDSNIFYHYKLRCGDVDVAFAKATHVIEHSFNVPPIAHAALEPHGTVALYQPGEGMTVWTSTQAPFVVRNCLSGLLDIPLSNVRVIAPYLGGGFGGKSDVTIEPLAGCLARAVPGRPVRLILDREEVFMGTTKGRGLDARYKTGISADGRIIAEKITLYWNGGAYADYDVNIVGASHNATGPYAVDNLWIDSYGVYTNTLSTGALRGYGHPEWHWACERQRDLIAKSIGMDPVAFRRKNILKPGLKNSLGQVMDTSDGDLGRCLEIVADQIHGELGQEKLPKHIRRGKGLAVFYKCPVMTTNAQSGAIIRMNNDGRATLFVGAVEMGQGVLTTMGQIAAEALGIPFDMVRIVPGVDTEYSPLEWQTVASHSTWAVGQAVIKAALDVRRQIIEAAAAIFGVVCEEVTVASGEVYVNGDPARKLSFKDVVVGYTEPGGRAVNDPVMGRGTFAPHHVAYTDPVTGQGNAAADWTMGCQGAEVEVDTRTGEIRVLKFVSCLDPGRIINPSLARNQIKGAVVQALGEVIAEKLIFSSSGVMLNPSLMDYKIPTAMDTPLQNEVYFVENPDKHGPYGAKGIGEHGTVGVAPALANAIANAIGIEFKELPLTPEIILERLREDTDNERRPLS
jgi:carbon-monoxide dehydrogenase large subunit